MCALYTYQGQDSGIGYSNYNQSLGHPMGANFNELLMMVNYQYKRFYASYKLSYIKRRQILLPIKTLEITFWT